MILRVYLSPIPGGLVAVREFTGRTPIRNARVYLTREYGPAEAQRMLVQAIEAYRAPVHGDQLTLVGVV